MAPTPVAASSGWYNQGYLIGSIINGNMLEPAVDAPAEVRTAFYSSQLYFDYMSYLTSQTAPYSGGIDFLGDALTQAHLTASAVTFSYVGVKPQPTQQQYLAFLQGKLATMGVTATTSQIAASLQHLRDIAAGISTTPAIAAIDQNTIVVTGWRPPQGPGIIFPTPGLPAMLPPVVAAPLPPGTGVTPLTSPGVTALVQSGAITKQELDAIKADLDGKLARGEITQAQYNQQAEQRIATICQERFPGAVLASAGGSRPLTAAETYQVNLRLGGSVDASKVRLQLGPGGNIIAWVALKVLGRPAITLGNTVYLRDQARLNFSDLTLDSFNYDTLLHEVGHVRQYQNNGFFSFFLGIAIESIQYGPNCAYEYWNRVGVPFNQQPLESQANIIGHYSNYVRFGVLPFDLGLFSLTLQQFLQFSVGSGVDGR